MLLMHNYFITFSKIKCDIRGMKKIICKPFFDNMLFIPCTYYKFIYSII